MIERRAFQSDVSVDDESLIVEGYATVFNSVAVIGKFEEEILPGAFAEADFSETVFLINHEGVPLASTRSGTLEIEEDGVGLRFTAILADISVSRDVITLIKRGDITGMSFAFSDVQDAWVGNRRIIKKIGKVWDVSVVTFAAYRDTLVIARSFEKMYNIEEDRKRSKIKINLF